MTIYDVEWDRMGGDQVLISSDGAMDDTEDQDHLETLIELVNSMRSLASKGLVIETDKDS